MFVTSSGVGHSALGRLFNLPPHGSKVNELEDGGLAPASTVMNLEDPVPAGVQRIESPIRDGQYCWDDGSWMGGITEINSVRDMSSQQEALIVSKTAATTQGLQELNNRLKRGWRVVQAVPMGGGHAGSSGGGVLAALVVIQRDDDTSGAVMEAEEEVEEVVEEIVEGNGSEKGIAEELEEERNGGA